MKKLISGISALLTAAMLIAPMSVFADTTINENSVPQSGQTNVTLEIAPTYMNECISLLTVGEKSNIIRWCFATKYKAVWFLAILWFAFVPNNCTLCQNT